VFPPYGRHSIAWAIAKHLILIIYGANARLAMSVFRMYMSDIGH
jgi:hypothetical protein